MVQVSDKLANHFKKDVHWCTKTPFVSTSKVFFFVGQQLEEITWELWRKKFGNIRLSNIFLFFYILHLKYPPGEPLSFYPFVQHVSSILHFAARGETEHWTLLHSCFLQILKVGFQNPAHNSIFKYLYFFICLWIPQLSHNDKRQMSLNSIHLFEL